MIKKYRLEIAVAILACSGLALAILVYRAERWLEVNEAALEAFSRTLESRMRYPGDGHPFGRYASDFFSTPESVRACELIGRKKSDTSTELQELIENGLDVNVEGKYGMTLLTWALYRGNIDAFRLLLDAGADPNVRFSTSFELHLVGWIDRDATVLTVANAIGEREFLDSNLFKGVQINQHHEAAD